jgi:uroporphyrin-III C-methyltransferase/precorrin-2 dehydrogenase/sirohydrochlorin ferrochelatase
VVRLYPLFLKLEGREVLVVGAGAVATRKVEELLACGARLRVVAPEATDEVRARAAEGSLTWYQRPFLQSDVLGAWLVVAATGNTALQRRIAAVAEERRIFVVAVDDVANASAYGAALVRRDPLTVAISSNGEAPALVRLLREIVEDILPDSTWIERARALRAEWRARETPMGMRFGELVRDFASRAGREVGVR